MGHEICRHRKGLEGVKEKAKKNWYFAYWAVGANLLIPWARRGKSCIFYLSFVFCFTSFSSWE